MNIERIKQLSDLIEKGKTDGEWASYFYKLAPMYKELTGAYLAYNASGTELIAKYDALHSIARDYAFVRIGLADRLYPELLRLAVDISRSDGEKDIDRVKSCFISAVKTRNKCAEKANKENAAACRPLDPCDDLKAIARPVLADIDSLYTAAAESVLKELAVDPVEYDDKYLAVIDEAEELIDKNCTTRHFMEYWELKRKYLAERGIVWHSPGVLNKVLF